MRIITLRVKRSIGFGNVKSTHVESVPDTGDSILRHLFDLASKHASNTTESMFPVKLTINWQCDSVGAWALDKENFQKAWDLVPLFEFEWVDNWDTVHDKGYLVE